MIGESAFCCLPIDIAVRLIGTISLLTNALAFIALVSDADGVLTDDKIRIIFGFDSQFFDRSHNNDWFHVFCLSFTLIAAISSALLIWASIIAQRWLTVPWLISSIFNIICHFMSLVMLSFTHFTGVDKWVTAFTVFYSVAILYFALVVFAAHYLWFLQSKEPLPYRGNRQDVWENVFKSPPLFESPYKNQV